LVGWGLTAHKSGDVVNFTTVTRRISSRLKRYKNYKNRLVGWLVGWGLTALLTQNRSYRACKFAGIFHSKL